MAESFFVCCVKDKILEIPMLSCYSIEVCENLL